MPCDVTPRRIGGPQPKWQSPPDDSLLIWYCVMATEYGTWLDSEESFVPAAQNGRASGACSLGDYRALPTVPVSGVALE